jgi:hypothetical protein
MHSDRQTHGNLRNHYKVQNLNLYDGKRVIVSSGLSICTQRGSLSAQERLYLFRELKEFAAQSPDGRLGKGVAATLARKYHISAGTVLKLKSQMKDFSEEAWEALERAAKVTPKRKTNHRSQWPELDHELMEWFQQNYQRQLCHGVSLTCHFFITKAFSVADHIIRESEEKEREGAAPPDGQPSDYWRSRKARFLAFQGSGSWFSRFKQRNGLLWTHFFGHAGGIDRQWLKNELTRVVHRIEELEPLLPLYAMLNMDETAICPTGRFKFGYALSKEAMELLGLLEYPKMGNRNSLAGSKAMDQKTRCCTLILLLDALGNLTATVIGDREENAKIFKVPQRLQVMRECSDDLAKEVSSLLKKKAKDLAKAATDVDYDQAEEKDGARILSAGVDEDKEELRRRTRWSKTWIESMPTLQEWILPARRGKSKVSEEDYQQAMDQMKKHLNSVAQQADGIFPQEMSGEVLYYFQVSCHVETVS